MQPSQEMRLALPRFDRIEVHPRLRDHVLVTLWFIVTFKQFRYDELLLYPLALYFGWAFVRDFPLLADLVLRSLILFLFPVWFFLTALWGIETELILRTGLQLLLTVMICYCVVLRLEPRDVMLSFLIAGSIFAVLSFKSSFSDGLAARGVFTSKNAMGGAMVLLWISSLSILLDPRFSRLLRSLALLAAVLALWQAFVSDSAGAILLILGASIILVSLSVIPRTGMLKRPGFYIVSFMLLAIMLFVLAAVLSFNEVDPIGAVLGAFGKDTTLTGRTVLWQYAFDEIRQRPFLGVGEGGFWRPYETFSTAKRIHAEFHKAVYANFSFHNAYLEVAVHQGLIGAAIAVLYVIWFSVLLTRGLLVRQDMPAVFFFCIGAVTLVRSMAEPGLMSPFSLLPTLCTIGALYELKKGRERALRRTR